MLTSDLIAATRRHVDGSGRGILVLLTGPLFATGAAQVTLPIATTSQIVEGTYLSAGLETFYVLGVDMSGTVTVLRAQDGTTMTAHQAGDLVRVSPRFTDAAILAALNDDIGSLSAEGIYAAKTLTRRFDPAASGYDLAPDMLDAGILEVRWQSTATETVYWAEITNYEISVGLPADVFPSGNALFLYQKGNPGQRFTIRYKAPLTPLVSLTDDVAVTTGLPTSALDIPPLGAAVRLHAGRPLQRADFDWQGEPRRAEEVRVVEVMQATAALSQLRARRVSAEVSRLAGKHPTRLVRR